MAIFRKNNNNTLLWRKCLFIDGFYYNHINIGYYNISSKFDFQGPGLKVKVVVAIFRKKTCRRSSPCIYQWLLILLHKNVGYDIISSKFDFQGSRLKVKVTMAIFFFYKSCHRFRAYIYILILI